MLCCTVPLLYCAVVLYAEMNYTAAAAVIRCGVVANIYEWRNSNMTVRTSHTK
jgi:hypothetical protein